LLNQVALAGFNLINSRIDAYRILKHKTIAHGINFGAYAVFCALLCWLARWDACQIVLFGVSAFCWRQITFDVPLNLRRRLPWWYMSTANPPKAFLDKIEQKIVGYNGRAITIIYGILWVACLLVKILFL
jgi:hypothetical protein